MHLIHNASLLSFVVFSDIKTLYFLISKQNTKKHTQLTERQQISYKINY